MSEKILLVDDDANVLQGYVRILRKRYELVTASSGSQAIQLLEHAGPFAIVVSDMRMPGMSGLDLLRVVMERWPTAIRIMLTGNADQQVAVDAVNHGQVFRFLTKPCSPEEMDFALEAGLRQYHLVQAEKLLLGKTLTGSVRVLSELLSCMDPEAAGRAQSIRERAMMMSRMLDYPDEWALDVAAMLMSIGQALLPPELLIKLRSGRPLTPKESALMGRVPEMGARLLENIPRMGEVARIVLYQAKGFDGSGYPHQDVCGEAIPLGSRILKVVADFTGMDQARKDGRVVLEEMKRHARLYDPAILSAWETGLLAGSEELAEDGAFSCEQLREGMALMKPVYSCSGRLVLLPGIHLRRAHLEMLGTLKEMLDLQEPIHVRNQ